MDVGVGFSTKTANALASVWCAGMSPTMTLYPPPSYILAAQWDWCFRAATQTWTGRNTPGRVIGRIDCDILTLPVADGLVQIKTPAGSARKHFRRAYFIVGGLNMTLLKPSVGLSILAAMLLFLVFVPGQASAVSGPDGCSARSNPYVGEPTVSNTGRVTHDLTDMYGNSYNYNDANGGWGRAKVLGYHVKSDGPHRLNTWKSRVKPIAAKRKNRQTICRQLRNSGNSGLRHSWTETMPSSQRPRPTDSWTAVRFGMRSDGISRTSDGVLPFFDASCLSTGLRKPMRKWSIP